MLFFCMLVFEYLKIYNETIRDLLMPGSALPIREDPGKGVVVPGLSLHKVRISVISYNFCLIFKLLRVSA